MWRRRIGWRWERLSGERCRRMRGPSGNRSLSNINSILNRGDNTFTRTKVWMFMGIGTYFIDRKGFTGTRVNETPSHGCVLGCCKLNLYSFVRSKMWYWTLDLSWVYRMVLFANVGNIYVCILLSCGELKNTVQSCLLFAFVIFQTAK